MDIQNIKRNYLDYLLTDVLPTELSERFTFSYFYDYLFSHKEEMKKAIKDLSGKKSQGMQIFEGWASMPLRYSIMKELHTIREMGVVQPVAAVEMLLFVEIHQKELLDILNKNSCFSIRYHKKNNELNYKRRDKNITRYFQTEVAQAGRELIEQTGLFFNIGPYKTLAQFTSSEEWLFLNTKYKFFIRTDYKACFDSIYTHSFSWIIGKDTIDTKGFKNSNIYNSLDRVLEDVNARRTNGIVVGPEFSRMSAEILLQSIDVEVNNGLINEGFSRGRDYNVFRFVDDIFIFAASEKLANHIVEAYSESARKYILRLNEMKLFRSSVPFVLDGWLSETAAFSNRACSLLFYTRDEVEGRIENARGQQDNNEESAEAYMLKESNFRKGAKAKQSVMNQLNELVCKYEAKDKTIVAYTLSTILNQITENNAKYRIFKKDVDESTVFSFLSLVFYIYSFFPSFTNTQKLLSIISYVRDEYDIFATKESLQKLINRYAFIFEKSNLNDVVNLFLFFAQAGIELPYTEEERVIRMLEEKDDPILWATFLLYAKYNEKFFIQICQYIEKQICEKIASIRVENQVLEYREFWWVLIFNKCPFITNLTQGKIDSVITGIYTRTSVDDTARNIVKRLLANYMKDSQDQFFDWDLDQNDFLRMLTFKSYEKSLFKNYKGNVISTEFESY